MKVAELLNESKRDQIDLLRDYAKWKKLVNMPGKTIEWMIETNQVEELGLTGHEWERIHGKRSARIPLNVIDKMRSKPFPQWESEWVNWMYRQMAMINHFLDREGVFLKEKGNKKIPTTKLRSLWQWGHVPRSYFPQKYKDDK